MRDVTAADLAARETYLATVEAFQVWCETRGAWYVTEARAALQRHMMSREYTMTTGELAAIAEVSPRMVVKWCDTGLVKAWRLPGSKDRRIDVDSAEALMREHRMDYAAERIRRWRLELTMLNEEKV